LIRPNTSKRAKEDPQRDGEEQNMPTALMLVHAEICVI
jgi:hypothetical protein